MSYGPYKEYVVEGAEMGCSACGVKNPVNLSSSAASIYGGFYIQRLNTKKVKIQSKWVCTEEDKKITTTTTPIYCIRTGMPCIPDLDEWLNPRGRAANVKTGGFHLLLDDAKIKCKNGSGILTFINSGQKSKKSIPGMGYISLPSKVREAGFFIKHPLAGVKIWQFSSGSNNISTIAVLFASNIELDNTGEKGTQVNAFRNTLWQAIITSEYGEDISRQAGFSHEENPVTLQQIEAVDRGYLVVSSLLDIEKIDEIIDLKNNIIGREIGIKNKNLNNTELAKILLNEFRTHGLYVAERYKNTDYYKITQQKIDDVAYEKAINAIDNGLDPKNKDRQNERG